MANTSGEKELKTDYPVVEGNNLGTTKLRDNYFLVPEEDLTSANDKIGVEY